MVSLMMGRCKFADKEFKTLLFLTFARLHIRYIHPRQHLYILYIFNRKNWTVPWLSLHIEQRTTHLLLLLLHIDKTYNDTPMHIHLKTSRFFPVHNANNEHSASFSIQWVGYKNMLDISQHAVYKKKNPPVGRYLHTVYIYICKYAYKYMY